MLIVVMTMFAVLCLSVFFIFCMNVENKRNFASVNYIAFDDSDIKIAGDHPSEQVAKNKAQPLQEDIADLLHINRENGNLDKARELGKRLATDICNFRTSQKYSEQTVLEMKTLWAFVIDYGFGKLLPNSIVSQTASNEFMMAIKNIDEEFYDYIQIAGSYSRYVLHSRKSDDLSERIGKSFAEFALHEGDRSWTEKGGQLFDNWFDALENRVDFYKFIK